LPEDATSKFSIVIYEFDAALEEQMKERIAKLDSCTDEQLEQAIAQVLARARAEVLNHTETQKFWQLCQEIQRRRASAGRAA
jgi:hypothetical protein